MRKIIAKNPGVWYNGKIKNLDKGEYLL